MRPRSEPSTQEALAGLVERVTYQNAENGFCVLRAKARGHRDLVTVVGHAATIAAGEWITASGEWINDRTHGQQFRARFLRTSAPTSVDGIENGNVPPSMAAPPAPALSIGDHALGRGDDPASPPPGDRFHPPHARHHISLENPDDPRWSRQDRHVVHDVPDRPILDPLDLRRRRRGLWCRCWCGGRGALGRRRSICWCRGLLGGLSLPRAGRSRK